MKENILVSDELKVLIDGVSFDHISDFSLTVNGETIDVTCFDSDGWKEFIKTDAMWEFSFNAFADFSSAQNVRQAIVGTKSRTAGTVLLTTEVSGEATYSGEVLYTSTGLSGAQGAAHTVAVSMQGTGELLEGVTA